MDYQQLSSLCCPAPRTTQKVLRLKKVFVDIKWANICIIELEEKENEAEKSI